MAVLTALNASGKRLRLEVEGEYSCSPWYSNVQVVAPLDGRVPDQMKTRDFNISPLGNHDYFMSEDLEAEPYERLSAQGGEFTFCASENPRLQGLAMWRGKYHEIATYVPATWAKDASFGLSWFEGMTFDDQPDGLVVSCDGSSVLADSLDVVVDGVGYFYVHAPQSGLGFVPEHSGARVGNGELWKATAEDGSLENLILAYPSAVAVGSPRGGVDAQPMLDFCGKVSVLEYEV